MWVWWWRGQCLKNQLAQQVVTFSSIPGTKQYNKLPMDFSSISGTI